MVFFFCIGYMLQLLFHLQWAVQSIKEPQKYLAWPLILFSFSPSLSRCLHFNRMALLDYPVPELDVTLQEVNRVLQLTLGPNHYPEFKSTIEQQREHLQEVHQKLATIAAGQENWVTEQFKREVCCLVPTPTAQRGSRSSLCTVSHCYWKVMCLWCGSELFAARGIPGRGDCWQNTTKI